MIQQISRQQLQQSRAHQTIKKQKLQLLSNQTGSSFSCAQIWDSLINKNKTNPRLPAFHLSVGCGGFINDAPSSWTKNICAKHAMHRTVICFSGFTEDLTSSTGPLACVKPCSHTQGWRERWTLISDEADMSLVLGTAIRVRLLYQLAASALAADAPSWVYAASAESSVKKAQ